MAIYRLFNWLVVIFISRQLWNMHTIDIMAEYIKKKIKQTIADRSDCRS